MTDLDALRALTKAAVEAAKGAITAHEHHADFLLSLAATAPSSLDTLNALVEARQRWLVALDAYESDDTP